VRAGYSGSAYGVDLTHYNDVTELRMNPVVRDAWADALESGDYEQDHNRLVTVYGGSARHCCLGVLCELAVEAGILERNYDHESYVAALPDGSDAEYHSSLPEVVSRWAGLWTDDPVVETDEHGSRHTLSRCNDVIGLNFTEIAQLIRTSL
jgi:hypothetical protein